MMHQTALGEWEEVPLPEGPQPLPDWITGLHIYWLMRYGNPPDVRLKTRPGVHDWPDQKWVLRKPGMYVTESGDGRAHVHYHNGILTPCQVQSYETSLGHRIDVRLDDRRQEIHPAWRLVPGEPRTVWYSTPAEGYAGRHFTIHMEDGREVCLVGPWFSGAPPGYSNISVVEWPDEPPRTDKRPWWQHTGTFGLCVDDGIIRRAFARYAPSHRIARLRVSNRRAPHDVWQEAMHGLWDKPKNLMTHDERRAAAMLIGETY